MYTQCPQCHAVFQLTAEQLKAAGGDVRCGQCLTIFNALENLSEAPPVDETLLDRGATTGSDASHYAHWSASSSPEAAQQASPAPPAKPAQEDTHEPVNLSEESFDFGDIEAAAAEVFESIPMDTAYDAAVDAVLGAHPDETETREGVTAYEPHFDKDSFDEERASHEPLAPDEVIHIELEDIPLPEDYAAPMTRQLETQGGSPDVLPDHEPAAAAKEPPAKAAEPVIPTLIREQLEEAKAEQLARPHPAWAVGGILLMLVFLGQVLFFSRHDLARDATLGPWIVKACETLGCTIQQKVSIDKIAILGWDVRSHPSVERALTASTTMINNADFNQPFPMLELRFSNMSGVPVSQRRFKPQEYLNDPALLKKGMEPDTPIHIELDLLDPGKNAVNFEFIPVALPHVALITKPKQ